MNENPTIDEEGTAVSAAKCPWCGSPDPMKRGDEVDSAGDELVFTEPCTHSFHPAGAVYDAKYAYHEESMAQFLGITRWDRESGRSFARPWVRWVVGAAFVLIVAAVAALLLAR